jgi:hypothetical protein
MNDEKTGKKGSTHQAPTLPTANAPAAQLQAIATSFNPLPPMTPPRPVDPPLVPAVEINPFLEANKNRRTPTDTPDMIPKRRE